MYNAGAPVYNTYNPKLKHQSKFRNWLYIRRLLLRNRMRDLRKVWKRFKDKGHETITFLVVPHAVDRAAFTLRISKFILAFLILLLSTVITFALLAMNDTNISHPRIRELTRTAGAYDAQYEAFRRQSRRTLDRANQLMDRIKHLAARLGVKDFRRLLEIPTRDSNSARPNQLLASLKVDSFNNAELRELDELNQNLRKATEQMRRLNHLFKSLKPIVRLPCFSVYSRPVVSWTPSFWPVWGRRGKITSPFGDRYNPFSGSYTKHKGVDIAWKQGAIIKATAPGLVIKAGWEGLYGYSVVILHRGGFRTRYAHLESAEVFKGDRVYTGQIIGRMGSTGRSTGTHVHYEVITEGEHVDPEDYMDNSFR